MQMGSYGAQAGSRSCLAINVLNVVLRWLVLLMHAWLYTFTLLHVGRSKGTFTIWIMPLYGK